MYVLEHTMEQYLMNFNNFEANMKVLNMSWEEQAFADDVAGHLGGFVWPPRSYSCNFCSREFRSAQALGGHMNVHRRDRARLKQNIETIPQNDQNQTNHPIPIPCKSVESSYPSQDLHHKDQGPGLYSTTRPRWDCKLAINDARKELDCASSNQPTEFCSTYDLEVIDTRKKQKKTAAAAASSSLMDFVRPCSNDILSSSSEDLDLELRLGETPNDKLK